MKRFWILTALVFLLEGCGVAYREGGSIAPSRPVPSLADAPMAFAKQENQTESTSTVDATPGTTSPTDMDGLQKDRKRIKVGEITVQVQDLGPVEQGLAKKVAKYKGFVASSYYQTNSYTASVRIPVDSFEAFLQEAGELGKILNKNTQVEDVTNQYFDLENRIKNKRILVERFQSYLREARAMEDILKVERQLNDVTTELERLEGSFKGLDRQVSYSTVNITFQLPVAAQGYQPPSVGDGFADLGRNLVEFGYNLFFGFLYVLIFGVPLVLVAAILWWLLFGKIGWLKALFRGLTTKKGTSPKDS